MIFNKPSQSSKIEAEAIKIVEIAKRWKKRFAFFPIRVSDTEIIWLQSYEVRNQMAALADDPVVYQYTLEVASNMGDPKYMIFYGYAEYRYKNSNGDLTTSRWS